MNILTVASLFLGAAIIVAVGIWSYDFVVARVFAAAAGLKGDASAVVTDADREHALKTAREGARWAHRNHSDMNIWAAVFFVVGFVVVSWLMYRGAMVSKR